MDAVLIMQANGCLDPGVTCRMAPVWTMWPLIPFVIGMFLYFHFEGKRIDRMEARERARAEGRDGEGPK